MPTTENIAGYPFTATIWWLRADRPDRLSEFYSAPCQVPFSLLTFDYALHEINKSLPIPVSSAFLLSRCCLFMLALPRTTLAH